MGFPARKAALLEERKWIQEQQVTNRLHYCSEEFFSWNLWSLHLLLLIDFTWCSVISPASFFRLACGFTGVLSLPWTIMKLRNKPKELYLSPVSQRTSLRAGEEHEGSSPVPGADRRDGYWAILAAPGWAGNFCACFPPAESPGSL